MKRAGNLMARIADMDNLREAFLLAVRGKACKAEVIRFRCHLDEELHSIHKQLLDGSYRFSDYRRFMVYDPKERVICATPFRERVTFHAMMRVCHPVFENFQISGSFASRPNLGTYKALEKAQTYCQRYQWFLKMDVRKFFASIDHDCMKAMLARLFKDRLLLTYFEMLIDGYEVEPNRGLPIGNLTSQYLANHYLAVADHFLKERLQQKALVRYMDDMVIWGNNPSELQEKAGAYSRFLQEELHMQLHPFCMNRTHMGMPFLGYVVYPHEMRLNQRSRHRYRQRTKRFDYLIHQGLMSEQEANSRIHSALAFITKANSRHFLQSI